MHLGDGKIATSVCCVNEGHSNWSRQETDDLLLSGNPMAATNPSGSLALNHLILPNRRQEMHTPVTGELYICKSQLQR